MKTNPKPLTENEQRNEFEHNARITAITEPDPTKQRKMYKDLGKWIKAGRPLIQANK
jgi:hypothetical protein